MKLIINLKTDKIVFKTTIKENKDIKRLIEHTLINNSFNQNINFFEGFDEIEAFTGNGGSVDLREDIISIHGDNGILDLEIINLNNVEDL